MVHPDYDHLYRCRATLSGVAIGINEMAEVLEVVCHRKDGVPLNIDFSLAPVQNTQDNRSGIMIVIPELI